MKSIKDFQKVAISNENKIYGGSEKTRQLDNKRDKIRDNGTIKTNIDWNPFNNDCHGCGGTL